MAGKARRNQSAAESIRLGERLRERRHKLGLNLKEVADGAGLSVGFISQVERSLAAPSLSSLVSISKVLKTDISAFLAQPQPLTSYTRQNQRPAYSIEGQIMSYERVSSSFPGHVLRSVIVHMPPGHRAEPISHEGEEMVFMLEGEITWEVDGKHLILRAGDSVHHSSSKRHSRWNHSDRIAKMLWVGTMELFGEDAARRAEDESPVTEKRPARRQHNQQGKEQRR